MGVCFLNILLALSRLKMLMAPNTWLLAINGENSLLGKILPSVAPRTASGLRVLPSFLSFTGTAGAAIITRENAYLAVDSRYWAQAESQTDQNWEIIKVGDINSSNPYKDWVEFLVVRSPRPNHVSVD